MSDVYEWLCSVCVCVCVCALMYGYYGPSPAALFRLVRSPGPDLHDDVQAVAECSAGQGETPPGAPAPSGPLGHTLLG